MEETSMFLVSTVVDPFIRAEIDAYPTFVAEALTEHEVPDGKIVKLLEQVQVTGVFSGMPEI